MEQFQGHITRVIFRKEGGPFAIAKFRGSTGKDQPTVEMAIVGLIPQEFNERDFIEVFGDWEEHEKFGRQLRIQSIHLSEPISATDMEQYLIHRIPGVGRHRAKLLREAFGDDLKEVLDNNPERMLQVKGIGKQNITRITEGWKKDAIDRNLAHFLISIGICGDNWPRKIRKALGDTAETIIRANPYRLVDVRGIGYKGADAAARILGFAEDSPERIGASFLYLLEKAGSQGHVCVPKGDLLIAASDECGIPQDLALTSLAALLSEDVGGDPLLKEERGHNSQGMVSMIYLRRLYRAETDLAHHLHRLINARPWRKFEAVHINLAIAAAERKLDIILNQKQKDAVHQALTNSASVLTGWPGTGKTTALRVLVQVAKDLNLRFSLAAPTGRAAKRMNEVTGEHASTIHMLLEFSHEKGGFQRDADNQLDMDLLIIDECSMVDVQLAEDLAEAIPTGCSVLFVGDPNQLPSVGPGRVLDDLMKCGRVPVVELTEVFRQAQRSLIVKNAHNILHGVQPQFFADPKGRTGGPLAYDCYLMEPPRLAKRAIDVVWIKNVLAKMCLERLPAKLGVDPIRDIQVLIPQKKGACGVYEINRFLQNTLNPRDEKDVVFVGVREYRVGDRVMVTDNNYKLQVNNGDIGFILSFDREEKSFLIDFGDRQSVYPFSESDDLVLAYASTIHKSQGSEYKVVIAIILTEHFIMLKRNLVYTAATRAKDLLLFIATRDALEIAVNHDEVERRNSLLALRLRAAQSVRKLEAA